MLLDRISDDPAHQAGFYPKSEARQPEHLGINPVSRRESKSGTARSRIRQSILDFRGGREREGRRI